ncbi:hypothetical protein C2845_PM18G05420 [Panicum miliaceum]|uniref:Uncharacterized protein n=1 Tax=Panicum miliaceum TaxID=4540 RepID=A0A3L6PJQ8_PANMI|nr:hypothetical protein C2845_PM18G05420 [Panicum miliaceum]
MTEPGCGTYIAVDVPAADPKGGASGWVARAHVEDCGFSMELPYSSRGCCWGRHLGIRPKARSPKVETRVRDAFREIAPRLELILEKDSVRFFLHLFESSAGMHSNLTVTAQTLTYMVSHNALRCARVVLEGNAPRLHGIHANANCMNQYGYFPLHEAAERFSVDMIKLLFRHGASANVRTVGNRVTENLLPLHVAVENACLHKYLEDNLSPRQDYQDYTYNLIHLLCLPEMKMFLDTIQLLAGKTENLMDELWKYIEGKKLVETAVLLLAAQGRIRGNHCSKRNVSGNRNGFEVILDHLVEHYEDAQKQLEERRAFKCTYLLVRIISSAGEVLHAYIQRHSEVPHLMVLEHVSSFLKDFGFCPTGEGMDVQNLFLDYVIILPLVLEAAPMTAKYLTENYMIKVKREFI